MTDIPRAELNAIAKFAKDRKASEEAIFAAVFEPAGVTPAQFAAMFNTAQPNQPVTPPGRRARR